MNLIRWFAAHPTAGNLLMLLILAAGIMTLPTLRRETFPEFSPEKIEVRVLYPGASAEDAELAICRRLEDALEAVNYVKELSCEARENLGIAVVEMARGGRIDQFLSDVKTEVDAIDSFPETAEDPVIRRLERTDRVISIAVAGPMAAPDLKEYAEALKDRLTRMPNVSQVTVDGFSDRQLRIELRQDVLRQYGLSVAAVAAAIARQSVDLPSGTLETGEREILVRFTEERRRPRDLESLIIAAGASGAEVRLGELATITDTFELAEDKIFFDGTRAALLRVTKTKTEDTLTVVAQVRRFLDQERAVAPPGVRFALTEDVSTLVQDRLNLLVGNGIQGLVMVLAVMWLFFGVRFSFWASMDLPVAFLGTLFVMAAVGLSINMITMVGLLIATGLLVDDSVVMSESIATVAKRGLSPLETVVRGVTRVGPGVFASFTTTACVFGPLAFLEGNIGKVLQVLPVVLLATLVVSQIEAFLVLPHHLAHSLAKGAGERPSWVRRQFDRGFDWFRDQVVGRLVVQAISWRYLTAGLAIFAFLGSVSMVIGGHLKSRAFPDLDGNVLQARILLNPGTPLARTEAVTARVVAALARTNQALTPRQPGGQALVQTVMVRTGYNQDALETGSHLATVTADLLSAEVRQATIDEISGMWRRELGPVADAVAITFKEPIVGPAGYAIEIKLQGEDLDELKAASLALRRFLAGYRGVVDLEDDLRPGKPERQLVLRRGAYELGLDADTIARQLRAAYYGITADEVQVGAESFEIDVRLAHGDRDSLADLDRFLVVAPGGAEVPLSTVVEITEGRGYARIARIDGMRTVTVRGDVNGVNANEVMAQVRREFFTQILPAQFPGVTVAVSGAQEEQNQTQASMMRGFAFGVLGIFLLLSFQFRSWLEPIVVMLAIPMSLVGVIWGHLAMGLELSMPSTMGFVALSGIVVNNAILLVEFTKHAVAEGLPAKQALAWGARERLRAMILTSTTTIVGMMPLLLEKNLQAQVLIPLVTSLTFGLLASTVLVIFVVPAFYAILDDIGWTRLRGEELRVDEAPGEREIETVGR